MQRRHFMAAAGAGIAGAVANSAMAQSEPKSKAHTSGMQAMQKCAAECYDCAQECDACAMHCAEMLGKGKQDHMKTLQSCVDCADVCRAAGAISARNGIYAAMVCKTCAEVCEACAAACEKHPDNEVMAKCAKACRDCAKECKNMVSHTAHA